MHHISLMHIPLRVFLLRVSIYLYFSSYVCGIYENSQFIRITWLLLAQSDLSHPYSIFHQVYFSDFSIVTSVLIYIYHRFIEHRRTVPVCLFSEVQPFSYLWHILYIRVSKYQYLNSGRSLNLSSYIKSAYVTSVVSPHRCLQLISPFCQFFYSFYLMTI